LHTLYVSISKEEEEEEEEEEESIPVIHNPLPEMQLIIVRFLSLYT